MSMGYSANYADVIEEKEFEKFPKVWEALQTLKNELKKHNIPYDRFAQYIKYSESFITDDKEVEKQINVLYETVRREFMIYTNVSVNIDYHNSAEYGDKYDDVDGVFWWVSGIYMLTKEGAALTRKASINRCTWVTFG